MRPRTLVVLLTLTLAAAGCAGSSSQTESDDTEATASSSSASSSEQAEAADQTESAEAQNKKNRPVVEMSQLIGAEIANGMPEGCPGEWTELEARNFDGQMYACDGFYAPHRYKEPTVSIGIREGQIRRVNLQSFYEPGDGVARKFDEVTNAFQQRCDREGGAGSRMMLDCGDYLVDIRMQREGGALNIVYGLENWDLPY